MQVVSGLPIRNENHAGNIASLALTILDRVSRLEIRHRPGELFQIRMGIHSGPVVSGVVGKSVIIVSTKLALALLAQDFA